MVMDQTRQDSTQAKKGGKSESVLFIPCAGRSFNLVGNSAAGCCFFQ